MPKFPYKLNPVHEAIIFAEEAHRGQKRKGTQTEYITHPMEVFQILTSMNANPELLMAGLLHDTVEDTSVTPEDIRSNFGERVAELVAGHTEDKSKTWKERKQHTIDILKTAERDIRLLILADKVANLRSLHSDYAKLGDEVWARFNAPKEEQAWYNGGVQDSLCDLQYDDDAKEIYWEMVAMFKDLFVDFFVDTDKHIIYQRCCAGESYVFTAESGTWKPFEGDIPEGAIPTARTDAERLEDIWGDVYADHTLDGNEKIEEAIAEWYSEKTKEGLIKILGLVKMRAEEDGHFILPADIDGEAADGEEIPLSFALKTIELAGGGCAIAAFTSKEELDKAPKTAALSHFIDSILESVYENESAAGLLLNPFGNSFLLDKSMIGRILRSKPNGE